ncbi:glutamyl-tRNA(Gln) amidotransferase subunit A [Tepiditoga spiralis]|uniref:Glutamyl-tRNA(Gln) amidotransferase subunit A n=1 Tax=Tepiditoga spiralis TaxID=2108365 RepID=A0A7G1GAK4_9BACT|nr:Asp-tRNA(Asn)/Glu-tRNA(Gln) amidotransferase subunit GatA [Tepiditoga spiralis]BBE31202.1 glutamyl-tRNA(Gln) amidotransferase subunit A [Tepiditoga spiralis]
MLKSLIGKNTIQEYVGKIEEKNKELNAVLRIEKVTGNKDGKYYGIPFLVKDNIQIEGTKLTCGSKILKNYNSVYTATAMKKLLDAGFSVIGKTNMDEFAMGSSNENSAYGPVKNPLDTEKIPGGSSGGSAAAVAAGMAPFAIGTDTGGSVRQPASFCEIVGYKPSYGMISRYGVVAFGSSLDQIGVLSTTVEDAATVVEIMKGKDEKDSTTVEHSTNLTSFFGEDIKGKKIAVPKIIYSEGVDKKILEEFENAVNLLKENGAIVEEIDIPELKYAVSIYYIIAPSEASSNLSRFDGVRYGLRKNEKGLSDLYNKTRDEGFGIEVKRRILMGTYTLSSAYYDAYFSKASKVRKLMSDKINNVLENYDLILTPTSPTLPPKIGEELTPLEYYLMDIFTIPANLVGLPAISVPFNKIGIQFIGKRLKDEEMLAVADAFEKKVGVH